MWEKYCLTVKEAAVYFGIGERKLRQIADDNPDAGFVLLNGSKMLFKRVRTENFLNECTSI